ncbi:MAG TPA: hypothetical protein PL188_11040 [Candidatus Cloacimonadota bacterium]|nr:hypothetical protein [Candidatus Cloacimonadota bacterium]
MSVKNLLFLRKIAKSSRADKLSRLIRLFVSGKLSQADLLAELETLYNRQGDARSTLNSQLSTQGSQLAIGADHLYQQIYQTITSSYPRRGDLREDQITSYTNTVSARAATTERLSEYQNRGVQMVKVVAYIDEATTDICRMMNGRIFELGPASQSLQSQDPLVHSESFWKGNHHFSQTPTSDMTPWLPPYHYNCRTRLVPYIEPSDPFDAAMDHFNNLIQLQEKHIDAIVSRVMSYDFASRDKLFEHLAKHRSDLGVFTQVEYMAKVSNLLRNPLKQMGLAISARDRTLNLYVWDPRVKVLGGVQKHDFAVFSLDKKCLKTFHPKEIKYIMNNLDPKVHGKVMMLTDQKISKGVTMAVGEHCVRCYEYIIDYFEDDDSTDEQEMFSRLGFEEEWDSIPEAFKQRILAVDKIVLQRYADWFDYNVFNSYIKCIRHRQELEAAKATTLNSQLSTLN